MLFRSLGRAPKALDTVQAASLRLELVQFQQRAVAFLAVGRARQAFADAEALISRASAMPAMRGRVIMPGRPLVVVAGVGTCIRFQSVRPPVGGASGFHATAFISTSRCGCGNWCTATVVRVGPSKPKNSP